MTATLTAMRRTALVGALALLATAGVACGGGSAQPAAPVSLPGQVIQKGNVDDSSGGAGVTQTVQMGDDWFSPTFIKVAPGARLAIVVQQAGDVAHTFTIDGQAVDVALSRKGTSRTITVSGPPDSRLLVFYCKYHRFAGMQGAIYT